VSSLARLAHKRRPRPFLTRPAAVCDRAAVDEAVKGLSIRSAFVRVLAHSGAPRGSVYHHFPGGRAQLIDEAVAYAGDVISGLIEDAAQAGDPLEAIDAFCAGIGSWPAASSQPNQLPRRRRTPNSTRVTGDAPGASGHRCIGPPSAPDEAGTHVELVVCAWLACPHGEIVLTGGEICQS